MHNNFMHTQYELR